MAAGLPSQPGVRNLDSMNLLDWRAAARAIRSARLTLAVFGIGVRSLQGLQIFFELGQQIAYRLDHRLHTHSFRFLQIVEYFSAPTYRSLCPGHPVSQFGQCQPCVIHLPYPQTAGLTPRLPPRRFSASTSRPPLRPDGAARQGRASVPPRPRSIAPRIAAGADTLTADRLPAHCRPAGLPLGVAAVPAPEALKLVSWILSDLFVDTKGRAIAPSVEVRPRRSIAPVLKKVSVDLLTIAQPLGLRRREQWLLPVERLSDRHPLFRNGHSRQNSNHRSDFDRGSPMIRHDRLHPWRCDRTLGLGRHGECEVPHSEDGIQKITPGGGRTAGDQSGKAGKAQ